jgi:hypothetical protein
MAGQYDERLGFQKNTPMPTFTHKIVPLALMLGLASAMTVRADDNNPVISVTSPAYCSEISGNTPIEIVAPGMTSVTVKSWKPGGRFGSDSTIGTANLDSAGKGSIVFPANEYPHGPITVTLTGKTDDGKVDDCYLQLYNKSGVHWNEGMPMATPPGAEGMRLVYADDFTKPLSISSTDPKARYYDHKPPNGSQDFSSIPFTGYNSPNNPFAQVDTYLRIRADAKKNSSGIISSQKTDGSGVLAKAPCYFECRFMAPNAKGTWPAFWLLTDFRQPVGDEIDIIEAYGGEGAGEPNSHELYQVTPHAWNQGDAGNAIATQAYKDVGSPISPKKFGVPSAWYEAMHTYGCKITETETVYYYDNVEIGRHKTLPLSKKYPFYFLVNLATGGGWKVDLSRYNGMVDMYVDFVRVYAK